MRVLVTGAGGFIGSALVRALVARGHEVVALVHAPAEPPPFPAGVTAVAGDVTRRASFESAAKDCDAIAHLALPDARTKYRDAYPVWIEGTRTVLAVAVERGMRAFAIASGCVGTYRHEPGAWVDETAPEEPTTRFTRGRAEPVALAMAAHREHGLPVAVMGPPLVYGRGGAFHRYFVEYMRRGRYRVLGDGANFTGFVHVEDCALAYALAVEKAPRGESFIIADDVPLALRDASDAIADALGVRRPGSVPPFLAGLVVGRDNVTLMTESIRPRNAKLKAVLGWSPTYPSLRDGLPSVVG